MAYILEALQGRLPLAKVFWPGLVLNYAIYGIALWTMSHELLLGSLQLLGFLWFAVTSWRCSPNTHNPAWGLWAQAVVLSGIFGCTVALIFYCNALSL